MDALLTLFTVLLVLAAIGLFVSIVRSLLVERKRWRDDVGDDEH